MEFNYKWMIGQLRADVSLSKDCLHLVILGDEGFLELLEGEIEAVALG